VAQIGELPVLDRTVRRVLSLCRDADSSTGELTAVLEHDAEFAANLLRFANSAYASRPVRVRTVRQAVTMAGRVAIGQLALEAATYRFLEKAPGNGRASVGLMHIHACSVGACALELAKRTGAAIEVAHPGGPAARHRQARDADRVRRADARRDRRTRDRGPRSCHA
jgi:HD-like signal output (HDOD) protein